MNKTSILDLGDRTITVALTEEVITSSNDSNGLSQEFIDGLEDMGSVTLFAEFSYGSGGTSCILVVDTSINQGEDWIEIARFDFATANRKAIATVSAGPVAPTTLGTLSADTKRDGILGDRLRARILTTGTYAGNTSISVRAIARSAAAGKDAADTLAQYLDGVEGLLSTLNGYVDGLESGQASLQTSLTAIAGYVDGVEALNTALNGYVDGLEALVASSNTKLDTIHTDLATTLAGLITTLNGYVDGLEALGAAALPAGSNVIGKVGLDQTANGVTTNATAATGGILNTARLPSAAASTNATRVKATPGRVYSAQGKNAAAYDVFLVLYDSAANPPVPGTTAIRKKIPIPAGQAFALDWPVGLEFAIGIGYAFTKLAADADTTALVAGDIVAFNLDYV